MMTMIRNRDTVAATPLNNSSLPVLSKNISMGAPFTLPPSVFHPPPHLLFRSFSPPLFLIRPRSFASLRSSSPSRKTGKIGTFPRRKLFQKVGVKSERGEGEGRKKGKVGAENSKAGNKGRKGGGKSLRCRKRHFFPFRPAFVSPESTRQVARPPPFFPFLSPRVTRNAKGFSSCFVPLAPPPPPSQIKR